AIILLTLSLAGSAQADLVKAWQVMLPGNSLLGVGHITNSNTLTALFGENDPAHNCCCGIYGFSILRVFDLNSGQVVATWAMECSDGSGIQPPADGIWLRDVDGDGRDEILCNLLTGDRVPAGVALLRYDSALGVITPGPRSSGPAELKAVPNPARRSVMIS